MAKTILAWSSGKDSAWTLYVLRQRGVEVAALLTSINAEAARVSMHGVRRSLVEAQAEAVGLPVWIVPLPWPCSNEDYEARMGDACRRAVEEGFTEMAFGDLFLRDVRAYRERQLAGSGLSPSFPLWEVPTQGLAREMISAGLRARLSCVDTRVLDRTFAGREFDLTLLNELPAKVDPCGENGEFHSFAYAGPMFRRPLAVDVGEFHEAGDFVFRDLLPAPVSVPRNAHEADSRT
jgi:uncharacterized protein (TIGR00290 family)